MNAISAYMAQRGLRSGNDRRNEYDNGPESRRYAADQRQPNQYTARPGMDENWPRDNGMERGGNTGGRMTYEDTGPESRYRGRDGRWKAGRRRSEYDGSSEMRAMDDERPEGNVIPWPYEPHMPPENRTIGFGSRERGYETRSHYDGGKAEAEVGGTMWMKPVHNRKNDDAPEIDRETAEKWVRKMHNEDSARPTGGRWSMEELKPMAQKFGIRPDSEEFVEFYAMTNAMYSDYSEVAKKFNISSPEFYGMMAKAWMDDKDAMPDKTALYYEYIVKK